MADRGRWHLKPRQQFPSLIFALALLFLFTSVDPARTQSSPTKSSTVTAQSATKTPDPQVIDLAGYQQLVAKYRGKPLVVNFWATWCEPCRDEYPLIVELAAEFKAQGISVIGINMDDDSDMNLVRRFIARTQPRFPNYRQKPGIDLDGFYRGVNPAWNGTMPQTIFYTRDGHINLYFLGTRPRPVFEQAFRDLLTKSAAQSVASLPIAGQS
ncbi:MAG TPA: TlpA disulfide reductase family protein [Candidatus Binatus sp.]|jgi:thiol-disulfide isomerase/thioredoxin|nr:TlpA disulfide reductase family protein [Candidatus Binatus sp.]